MLVVWLESRPFATGKPLFKILVVSVPWLVDIIIDIVIYEFQAERIKRTN
jgi:hypothetical protein